jgi:thiol-disulfide isomerase/thioredoxin
MRWMVALALVVLISGCGSQQASTSTPGGSAKGTGQIADLDFTGTMLDGSTFQGPRLAGKPAVLWFWAPWCPTCRAQSDNVSALAKRYDGQVTVVGVGGLDGAATIEEVAAAIPDVTHLVDERGRVWQHFRVTAQSTYTVIAADGEIVAEGYLDDAALNDLVARLVADAP